MKRPCNNRKQIPRISEDNACHQESSEPELSATYNDPSSKHLFAANYSKLHPKEEAEGPTRQL
jgi:hypothetical protein